MKNNTMLFLMIVSVATLIVVVVSFAAYGFGLNRIDFQADLAEMNIMVTDGLVESPAIIIEMDNRTDFLNKITELNATIIYFTGSADSFFSERYYVFTKDYNIAYRFDLVGNN